MKKIIYTSVKWFLRISGVAGILGGLLYYLGAFKEEKSPLLNIILGVIFIALTLGDYARK